MVIQFAGNKKDAAARIKYTAFCDYNSLHKQTTVMVKVPELKSSNRIKRMLKDLQITYMDCGKIISHRYNSAGVEIDSISSN